MTTLLDIINAFQDAQHELQGRVVRYDSDGKTPLIVEYTKTDDEGTIWITTRNVKTGEGFLRHIP